MNFEPLIKSFWGPKAQIETCRRLAQHASARCYYRIVLKNSPNPVSTAIVMALPNDPMAADEITQGAVPTELPFLNMARFMKSAALPVPQIYVNEVDNGAVILEDLGDRVFETEVSNCNSATQLNWYECAVDLLANMHDQMWPIPNDCIAGQRSFNFELLRWELGHYQQYGLETLNNQILDPDDTARLDAAFNDLAGEIADLPLGFVHRDYQSKNLMVQKPVSEKNNLTIIDFQDALIGPRVYDLVALLCDSYVTLPFSAMQRLIHRYARLRHLDREQIQNEFDLVTIQRKLKDGGRFVFIDKVKNNSSFLPYVEPSFGHVKQALNRIQGHKPLKEILRKLDPKRF